MTHWIIGCCLLGLSVCPETSRTIDSFTYSDAEAARRIWRGVAERGQELRPRVVKDEGRKVLEMPAPFASQPDIPRVYLDRDTDLNLAAAGELKLEVLNTTPESGGRLSLYFRSGEGWYAAGAALTGDGWQTLRFSKAAFSTEGEPTGWHNIDGIRIAVWRGQSVDSSLRVRELAAVQHDVAVIIPSAGSNPESQTAARAAEDVAKMLSELGLGSDAIEDEAMLHGALGDRRVAILAYHPDLSAECVDELVTFVEDGGKVLVCYQLPRRLGAALGFTEPQYHRPDDPGALAEIRFLTDDISGLPARVRQSSWNITTARPADFNARVIGHWYGENGRETGYPALLLSDRGAFFSHIILGDDWEKKKQMLAAVLGHLAQPLWKQMASHALSRSGHVGHLDDYEDLVSFVKASNRKQALEQLNSAEETRTQSRQAMEESRYAKVVEKARQARSKLVRAYLVAHRSKPVEGRAFWNHSGTGAYDGDWDRTARELTEAGFNMVMPNMLWGGRAHYPSDVLPRSRTHEEHGDQISQCLAAARKHGLQVHVWKVNWNLSGAPRSFVQRIHAEHRNQVSVDGEAHDWLCPSHPDNVQLELDSMLEVARKYDVDGLHFDYIRYPGRDKCYCDGCRERFEADFGKRVSNWPEDCYSGELRDEYAAWRCDQITHLVKAVHEKAKQLRPDIEISAAVFSSYPNCKNSVAQDWLAWVEAGYLDFICPMDYTQNDQDFINRVSHQLDLVDGRIPVYPGIGQWRLTNDRTVGQIHHARRLGAPGFTLFNLTGESIRSVVPAIGLGVGREEAETPHRQQ
ncbi:MAG: glycoside hydrolase family 10 protein [Planctomycetota bacterium]